MRAPEKGSSWQDVKQIVAAVMPTAEEQSAEMRAELLKQMRADPDFAFAAELLEHADGPVTVDAAAVPPALLRKLRKHQRVKRIRFSRAEFSAFIAQQTDQAAVAWLALSGETLTREDRVEVNRRLANFFEAKMPHRIGIIQPTKHD
jgi:hypothetical protein